MDTAWYDELVGGSYLTRESMEWFWDAYTSDTNERPEITASPNPARVEQLRDHLPQVRTRAS